jgi:hypothetical protein
MSNLLSALIFSAALTFGLGTASSFAYACDQQSAQAEDGAGLVQLAMDEDSSDDDSSDDDGFDDDGSDGDGE